jgi:hypothetical protein
MTPAPLIRQLFNSLICLRDTGPSVCRDFEIGTPGSPARLKQQARIIAEDNADDAIEAARKWLNGTTESLDRTQTTERQKDAYTYP